MFLCAGQGAARGRSIGPAVPEPDSVGGLVLLAQMAVARGPGALVQRVHEQVVRLGRVAVLVVLLFGDTSRHGRLAGVAARRLVLGAARPVAGLAAAAFRAALLVPAAQGAALHHLRFPSAQHRRRRRLHSIVRTTRSRYLLFRLLIQWFNH